MLALQPVVCASPLVMQILGRDVLRSNCCATGTAHCHLNGASSKGLNLSVHFCIYLDCYCLFNFDYSSISYPQIQLCLKAKPLFLVKMQVNVESWHKKGEKIIFLGNN